MAETHPRCAPNGLTWAVAWAVGGVFFSAVLPIAGRRHRFRDLSLPKFAAWGAVGGVLLILFPFALMAVGLASGEGSSVSAWQAIAVITGPFLLMSAASAAGSLLLARRGEDRASLEANPGVEEVALTEGEARERAITMNADEERDDGELARRRASGTGRPSAP